MLNYGIGSGYGAGGGYDGAGDGPEGHSHLIQTSMIGILLYPGGQVFFEPGLPVPGPPGGGWHTPFIFFPPL
jgi:hypothetical protein